MIETLPAVGSDRTAASFYRTAAGAEIDLVLELPGGHGLWAIEIKRGLTAAPGKGFHTARADLRPARTFVVHGGEERYPVAAGVDAIGLRAMADMLARLNRTVAPD